MDILREIGVQQEIQCGNNFGYVLENSTCFVNTDYKVLLSQTNGIFIRCMKMLYNGKIELYYITEEYQPMSSILSTIMPDRLITIMVNIFANVIEVRNNGFLTCQNIVWLWDKIYVDPNTLKVKLVYLPVNSSFFEDEATFESELRSSMIKLINRVMIQMNQRLDQFIRDLSNGSLSLEDVYNRARGGKTASVQSMPSMQSMQKVPSMQSMQSVPPIQTGGRMAVDPSRNNAIRMVAMNAPQYFDILLDREHMLIGKKENIVDVVIPFNKMISRKHCLITIQNGAYFITDVGSANGTFVNGLRIVPNQPSRINRGDIIRLADSDFQIV